MLRERKSHTHTKKEWFTMRSEKHFPEGKSNLVSGEDFSDRWKGLEIVKSQCLKGNPYFWSKKLKKRKINVRNEA